MINDNVSDGITVDDTTTSHLERSLQIHASRPATDPSEVKPVASHEVNFRTDAARLGAQVNIFR